MDEFKEIQVNSLNELFQHLHKSNINYCILRNYENIPENIGNDIDFLVDEKNLEEMEKIIFFVMKQYGLKLLNKKQRYGYKGLYFIETKTQNIILLDLFTKLSKKWISYADVNYILQNKIEYKNFYVPKKSSILYTVLLKDLLTYDKLRNKNNDLLLDLDEEVKLDFIQTGLKYFDAEILENLFDDLKVNKIRYSKKYLFSKLKTDNNIKNFLEYTSYRIKEILQNLFFNKMYFISIIGPDGVGKSTVTSNLKRDLQDKGLFKKILDIHHRFEFIPNISQIFKRKEIDNKVEEKNIVTNPQSRHTWYRTLIYVCYYSIDFILGYFKVLKYKAQGGMVIADRYYYDFYIQKHYDNLPYRVKNFFYYLIPHPNVLIFLSADPEKVYKRKHELTLEETKEQNSRCMRIIKEHNGFIVDADQDAENVNNQIKSIIYKRMLDA